MEQKKYWQSFGEQKESDAYQSAATNEFQEDLPFEADDNGFLQAKTPRRDFLKYVGFSTAAAAVAASCEMPVKKAIPFVNKPDNVIPGVANYYATTFVQDGEAVSVVAKVRDGRPIKIEGNDLCPLTKGGTSAKVQASVLDLYDTSRLRYPMASGKEVSTFEAFDKMMADEMAGMSGAPVVLLTSSVSSPTTKEVISQFLAKNPGSRHVQYDGMSYTGMLLANEATYGKRAIPSYHFDAAKVVVSLDADFLGTWVSPIEYAKQYAKGRRINEKNPVMSRHIQFESLMSMTGANADERFHHRPSDTGKVALAIYAALGGSATAPTLDADLQKGITKTVKYLNENKGASLVVCGSNDPNVQIVVNGINELLGAGGTTIDWSTTYNTIQGIDGDMAKLIDDMNAGAVGGLFVYEANPAYDHYDSKRFVEGLKKVKCSVSFSIKMDETTEHCKYVIPSHHYLESWGDTEVKTGYYSLLQPTIYPLFKTRQWQDNLLLWSGSTSDYLATTKQYWIGKLGSEVNWDKALQDGVITPATTERTASAGSFSGGGVAQAAATLASATPAAKGKKELVLYYKVSTGTGVQANNPWLQENPDPITKACWDNYVMISPITAKEMFGIDMTQNRDIDAYEVHPEKQVVKVSVGGKSIELAIMIVPGTNPDTIGIALGYGRGADCITNSSDKHATNEQIDKAKQNIGKAGAAVGKNANPFVVFNGVSRINTVAGVDVADAGYKFAIAQNQTHLSHEGRKDVVMETTLATLKKTPKMFSGRREHLHKELTNGESFQNDATIYPADINDRPGLKWGMSIDMNTCTGCHACVVACNAENNVAVVGKHEVTRAHDMQWLRIDRYFSGDINNPTVVFQPMLCQHCDNAPCENVCPVAATNHSSEGLNQMIYNRCIGTRYCGNNCPYKVRRFNWADYMGADSFPDNQSGVVSETSMMMNDDLTRMVLNPDVTVRSRGVIEKCSFCVQRLQEGKLIAKKASRPLFTGEENKYDLKTACQQACPSDAIIFGNANSSTSEVSLHRAENNERIFYALEMLHVLPNVSYLAKVRNTDEVIVEAGHGAEPEHKKEAEVSH